MLATATLLGMGVSGPVMGWFADNKGRKFALNLCLTVFILLTAAVYFVPNYASFLVLRFLAGIGLGGVWSIISAFVVETWPARQRGKAVAFVHSSFPIGGVLAAQFASWMMPNWRVMFLAAGLSAIFPLLLSIFVLRESAEWQAQHIASQRSEAKSTVSVKEIFEPGIRKTTILASLVATMAFIAYYGASTWLPSYLESERGLDPQTVGQFMTWLNLGMFAGYIVFGWLADKIGKKNALLLSMFGSGVLMPLYGVVTDQSILLWLGPAYAFFMTFAGLFGSYLGELYPTRVRATAAGFTFNVGRGISAFAPMILGGVAAAASFAAGLVVAGAIFLVGGVFLLFLPQAPSDRKPAKSTVTPEGVPTNA